MKKKKITKLLVKDKIILQLFVSGMSPKSMEAIENIKQLCDVHLKDAFELEIVDLYKNPQLATESQIIFSPSLIKKLPLPKKVMVGNFSKAEKVIKGLGIVIEEHEE